MASEGEKKKYLQSFGRTKSRKLRENSLRVLRDVLPKVSLNLEETSSNFFLLKNSAPTLWGVGVGASSHDGKESVLEIGFGGGEHLLHQAIKNPQNKYIGCEPFVNGTVKLLRAIEEKKIENIRIYNGDFRVLAEELAANLFEVIYILFPDPWPKKKQNKRRLIGRESLEMLVRLGKNGGRIMVATDHLDYAKWILRHVLANPNLRWLAQSRVDWQTAFDGHITTKYQNKAMKAGRNSIFFEVEIIK